MILAEFGTLLKTCTFLWSSRWAKCDKHYDLLQDLLPGKVTTIFKRRDVLNSNLNPGISLVGVRIPDHQFVRRLVRDCGQPMALTSANISDTRSTLEVEVCMYTQYPTGCTLYLYMYYQGQYISFRWTGNATLLCSRNICHPHYGRK